MTEVLVWRDEWLLHIDPLDADHKEMVRLLNRLANSRQTGATDPHEELLGRMDTLVSHIRGHFLREEAFLESIGYPGLPDHKREHTLQMAAFSVLRKSLSGSGASALDPEDIQGIKMWFLDHVFGEDKHYADFYHRKGAG